MHFHTLLFSKKGKYHRFICTDDNVDLYDIFNSELVKAAWINKTYVGFYADWEKNVVVFSLVTSMMKITLIHS